MVTSQTKPGYTSNRGSKLSQLSKAQFYTQDSPTGKEPIKYKLVYVPSEKIEQTVRKSKLNKRSEQHLNMRALSDILPGIKEAKKNDHPCKAYGTIDSMVIMEGLRRSYAVRSVDGAQLAVWLAEYVHPEDEAVIVSRADKYREPTTVDLSLTMKAFLEEADDKYTVRELAKIFDVSRGTAQNAKDLMALPDAYFKKYPSLNDVTLSLAMKFAKHIESLSIDQVARIVDELPEVTAIDDDGVKMGVKELEVKIKSTLQGGNNGKDESSLQNNPFDKLKLKKGVVASMSSKGVLSIKIPSTIDDVTMKKITDLLTD